jgi:hypothetical protein
MLKKNIKFSLFKHPALMLMFLLLFAFSNPSYGNDATYYGSGVTVYPVKNDKFN